MIEDANAGRMMRLAIAMGVALVTAANVHAQTTRAEEVEQEKAEKAAQVEPPVREKGDVILEKVENIFMPEPPALSLSFGGFRPGAGLAPGIAYVVPVGEHALWTTRTAWSFENFKLAESDLDLPKLAGNRVDIQVRAKWEDAPRLAFFGIGNGTPHADEVSYGLRSSEADVSAEVHATRWLRLGGSVGFLAIDSENGDGPLPSIDSIFTPASAPGLGSNPHWLQSTAFVAVDTRESPGYTRRGGLYQIAFHDYADPDGRYSFDRTEIDVRQFAPVLHDNWIVALQARADLTSSADGQEIPFFMLPYLGGGDTLRGFSQYRFMDRNSLQLRGELRWTATSVLDMAVFMDQGTVAATWQDLDLHALKSGWGLGARLHGSDFTALRLEAARSSEGWQYHISQTLSF